MNSFDRKVALLLIFLMFVLGGLWFHEQSFQLPEFSDETIFYLGTEENERGKLMMFDPLNNQKHPLSKEKEVINQFMLYELNERKYVYYLTIPEQKFSDDFSIVTYQDLYMFDLEAGKKRKINKPSNMQFSSM